jgi:hypothetical protein
MGPLQVEILTGTLESTLFKNNRSFAQIQGAKVSGLSSEQHSQLSYDEAINRLIDSTIGPSPRFPLESSLGAAGGGFPPISGAAVVSPETMGFSLFVTQSNLPSPQIALKEANGGRSKKAKIGIFSDRTKRAVRALFLAFSLWIKLATGQGGPDPPDVIWPTKPKSGIVFVLGEKSGRRRNL